MSYETKLILHFLLLCRRIGIATELFKASPQSIRNAAMKHKWHCETCSEEVQSRLIEAEERVFAETSFSQSRLAFAANRRPLTSVDWPTDSGWKDCVWDGVAVMNACLDGLEL